MKWEEKEDGFLTLEGYVIKGKPDQDTKMKMYHPGDLEHPVALGNELVNLQLIAEGHLLSSGLTAFSVGLPTNARKYFRVGDEARLRVCESAASAFMGLYPKMHA